MLGQIGAEWGCKGFGIPTHNGNFTNLRFADDLIIVAKSKAELEEMLGDAKSGLGKAQFAGMFISTS